jgi:hypothetical protein
MSVRVPVLIAAIAAGSMLLAPLPALACRGDCGCEHSQASAKAPKKAVAATCNCEGPGDCTCKKGECKCKKCSKHHADLEAKKT